MWSREEIVDLLANEARQEPPAIEGFAIQVIATDVILATYRAVRAQRTVLRSSLWVRSGEGWRMLFHQRTKISDPASIAT
jgi:ribonuclease HI